MIKHAHISLQLSEVVPVLMPICQSVEGTTEPHSTKERCCGHPSLFSTFRALEMDLLGTVQSIVEFDDYMA